MDVHWNIWSLNGATVASCASGKTKIHRNRERSLNEFQAFFSHLQHFDFVWPFFTLAKDSRHTKRRELIAA